MSSTVFVTTGYKNVNSLLRSSKSHGILVTDLARTVLQTSEFLGQKRVVRPTLLYPDRDRGLSGRVQKEVVQARAAGLVPTTAETAVEFWFRHTSLLNGGVFCFAGMLPVEFRGDMYIFYLGSTEAGERWVNVTRSSNLCLVSQPWLYERSSQ